MSLDDNISVFIIQKFPTINKIHPDVIVISGLVFTYLIHKQLFTKKLNIPYICVLLGLRYIVNILDGKTMKKKTKFGKILKHISDFILLLVITHYFGGILGIDWRLYIVILMIEAFVVFGKMDLEKMKNK